MIGLIGMRPKSPAAQAAIADLQNDSATTVVALTAKAQTLPTAIFEEKDFPNHWGKVKHIFAQAQYGGKCAYCETRTSSGNAGDVEHFRPKAYSQQATKAATDLNDIGGKAPNRKMGAKGAGYWWLAYDWSNYLYSCSRCNSSWKRNQFPIRATRVQQVGGNLATEQALLINPFDVDPSPHFDFDFNTGQIRGTTPEGTSTVDVCGLSRRSLELDRAIKGAKLKRRFQQYMSALVSNNVVAQNNALSALLDECRSKEPYAAMARLFVKNKIQIDYPTLLKMKRKRLL